MYVVELVKIQSIAFYFLYLFIMKKNEILDLLQSLAKSQGCWGRLLCEVGDNLDEFLDELESMNFKSGLDLILFLEGN